MDKRRRHCRFDKDCRPRCAAKDCCEVYNIDQIYDVILLSKNTLSKLNDEVLRKQCFGFNCDIDAEDKIDKLTKYCEVLSTYKKQALLGHDPYLCPTSVVKLIDNVYRITGKNCHGLYQELHKDESEKEQWVKDNPNCVSYQKWEKWARIMCTSIQLGLIVEQKESCDLDIDFNLSRYICDLTLQITRKEIDCDVLVVATAFDRVCELDLVVDRNDLECELDFKLLHEKIDCDIEFKLYRKLIDCGVSYEMIKTVYDCGLSLDVKKTHKSDEVVLKTAIREYKLNDLKVDVSALRIQNLKPTISVETLLQDHCSRKI